MKSITQRSISQRNFHNSNHETSSWWSVSQIGLREITGFHVQRTEKFTITCCMTSCNDFNVFAIDPRFLTILLLMVCNLHTIPFSGHQRHICNVKGFSRKIPRAQCRYDPFIPYTIGRSVDYCVYILIKDGEQIGFQISKQKYQIEVEAN